MYAATGWRAPPGSAATGGICTACTRAAARSSRLFPGFTATLTASGAVRGDALGNVRWQLSGHQLRQATIGLPVRWPANCSWKATSGTWCGGCPQLRSREDCSVSGSNRHRGQADRHRR